LDAEPIPIEIDVTEAGDYQRFGYAGFQVAREKILRCFGWVENRLRGRKVVDLLKRWRKEVDRPEFNIVVRNWQFADLPGIDLEFVDPDLQMVSDADISLTIYGLLKTTYESGYRALFTCATCGFAGCAGIFRSELVIQQDGYTLTKFGSLPGRPLRIYQTTEYRKAVIDVVREMRSRYRAAGGKFSFGGYRDDEVLVADRALFEAENYL